MSARKIANTELLQQARLPALTTQLDLPADAVHVRKNGIEFRSVTPFPVWAEMTVAMQTPHSAKKVNFTGVIVSCTGNRHAGYLLSMVFTNVSKQAQARLNSMVMAP